jgi:hypothetical protein
MQGFELLDAVNLFWAQRFADRRIASDTRRGFGDPTLLGLIAPGVLAKLWQAR